MSKTPDRTGEHSRAPAREQAQNTHARAPGTTPLVCKTHGRRCPAVMTVLGTEPSGFCAKTRNSLPFAGSPYLSPKNQIPNSAPGRTFNIRQCSPAALQHPALRFQLPTPGIKQSETAYSKRSAYSKSPLINNTIYTLINGLLWLATRAVARRQNLGLQVLAQALQAG